MQREAGTFAQTRRIYLARLERLIRQRRDYREDLNDVGLQLLDRAIEATFRDCETFGGAAQARNLMPGRAP